MPDAPETADFESLLERRNVIAVSYDKDTDTVDVWVSQKLPLATLDAEDVVANNVPADVTTNVHDAGMGEEADGFTPELLHPETETLSLHTDRHDRHRPVLSGVSECNATSTAATAGHYPACITDTSKGKWSDSVSVGDLVRISNCHVYARSGQADLGEQIVQPSRYDGGDEDDTTGDLVGYLSLEDSVRADVAARSIDLDQDTVEPHEMDVEWPTAICRTPSEKGETLTKTGRTTGVTSGNYLLEGVGISVGGTEIDAVDATVERTQGNDTMQEFEHELLVRGTDGVTNYEIDVSGDAGLITKGEYAATEGYESVSRHDDGSATLKGIVASGGGDTFVFDGEVTDVRSGADEADPELVVDGEVLDLSQLREDDEDEGNDDEPSGGDSGGGEDGDGSDGSGDDSGGTTERTVVVVEGSSEDVTVSVDGEVWGQEKE